MINPEHFRELVVRPTIIGMGSWSPAAENLLMGTAIQESGLRSLKQIGGGPALGVFQMEPSTHDDIWMNYLNARDDLKYKVLEWHKSKVDPSVMTWNLAYATAMARVHYLRVPAPLPAESDIQGLGEYWKKYYNTPAGAGTSDEFVNNYIQQFNA
jgi:hypothetical protein